MAFEFTPCIKNGICFSGLYEIYSTIHGDKRGYLFESYSKKAFYEAGLTVSFVQDNQSASMQGVLRGLHFQTKHPQDKLVMTMTGRVYDVAVDLRKGSPTFGMYYGVILDAEKHNQFYIPKGFAHGFYVLSDYAVFAYKCTDFYDPDGEGGLLWNDPTLAIDWPLLSASIQTVIAEKDTKYAFFDKTADYFDSNGSWIGV